MTGETIDFFVAGKPGVKGNSKRIVRFGRRMALIANAKDKAAEESLHARVMTHRPKEPWTGPLCLDVTFYMPMPASMPMWRRAAALTGGAFPTTRPDRGNMLKLVEDALEGPFYLDDAQIVAGSVRKLYSNTPGYKISITRLLESVKP